MQRSTLAKRAWLLLIAVTIGIYLYGLSSFPLVGPDEPRYAQVAREMWLRGDLVTPTLAGQTWFEKPALLYWVMMAAYQVFGVSEWSARFGSACAGLITVLLAGWLAGRVEFAAGAGMRGLGLAGAAVMATSAGLIVFAHAASFDILLTLTVTLSLACFFVSELERRESDRKWLLAGFYIGIGMSLLAKGLVGIILPGGVVAVYFIMRRRWAELFRVGLKWWGLLIVVGVAAIWYGPVIARHGWEFVDEFFVQHHFARYVSNKYKHPQPFYFYLPIAALLALPWTAFVCQGAVGAASLSWRADDVSSKFRLFALAWLLVPIAFFSLSGSKLPGYILPALPGAALLASERLARYARGEGQTLTMRATGLLILLAAGGVAYAVAQNLVTYACGIAIGLPMAVAGLTTLFWTRRRALCAVSVVGATFAVVALIVVCGVGPLGARESVRDLLKRGDELGYAAAPIVQLHTVQRTAEFYGAGRLDYDPHGEPLKLEGAFQVAERAQALGSPVLVIVPVEYVYQLTNQPGLETELLADDGERALVVAKTR